MCAKPIFDTQSGPHKIKIKPRFGGAFFLRTFATSYNYNSPEKQHGDTKPARRDERKLLILKMNLSTSECQKGVKRHHLDENCARYLYLRDEQPKNCASLLWTTLGIQSKAPPLTEFKRS